VADAPLPHLQRLHDAAEVVGQRIETKAALFLGLISGLTAFGTDQLLRGKVPHFYQASALGTVFVAATVFLFGALAVRKHKELKVGTVLAEERLSCERALDIEPYWTANAKQEEKALHESEHLLAYSRYISEQMAEVVIHNTKVNAMKARCLKFGVWSFVAQTLLLVLCMIVNEIIGG
jgi:TM2 domain-containing membrane protein YozV